MNRPPQYKLLLHLLRMLADQNEDHRSLVAIAAQFERDCKNESVAKKAHCRNATNSTTLLRKPL